LLDKPEARRFVKEFLNSWLKLDEINDTDPDRDLYPEYAGDWWLVNSMVEESRLYFADLVASDRPARNVIDADYAFLDERLARHYGVPGISGPSFRLTPLPKGSPYETVEKPFGCRVWLDVGLPWWFAGWNVADDPQKDVACAGGVLGLPQRD
jgi:hypothetical protein